MLAETLDPVYEDNLDIARLGHILHSDLLLTGKISSTPAGFSLNCNVSDVNSSVSGTG
jgi:hypothetical protein